MKTIGHWPEKYPLLFQLPDNALIEIQRDAREGMVPVDDVAYCIHNSDKNLCASGPALLAENQRLREALRGVCEVVGHYAVRLLNRQRTHLGVRQVSAGMRRQLRDLLNHL